MAKVRKYRGPEVGRRRATHSKAFDPPPEIQSAKFKLTNEMVGAIRLDMRNGAKVTDLAQRYGVTRDTVARAAYGLGYWAKVKTPTRLKRPALRRLNPFQVAAIRKAYAKGASQSALAARYEVSPTTVWQAIHVTWPGVTDPPHVPPAAVGGRRPIQRGTQKRATLQRSAV